MCFMGSDCLSISCPLRRKEGGNFRLQERVLQRDWNARGPDSSLRYWWLLWESDVRSMATSCLGNS
ncbi:UNVERIFIED_ORG: hypothetical protein J2Y76_001312 [Pseudomonas reinekei]|nr:hypothetical protein [Pseudomonas reinekei]